MKLKNILYGSLIFLSLNNPFSNNRLNIYSDVVNLFGIKPSIGYVEFDKKSVEASFLLHNFLTYYLSGI